MKNRRIFNRCPIILLLLFVVVSIFSYTQVNAANSYPKPTELKYVNDYTSTTIDEATKNYIVSVGKELEDKSGAQEVVVVVDSLQGSDIQVYANELFRTWGIGQKDKNNGLLILVSLKDRQWRVEVGTGLEGAIPDIYSARVMDSLASPKFQQGNYSEGIKEAYSVFADTIAKEYNVTLDKNEKITLPAQDTSSKNTANMVMAGIFFAFILLDFIFNRGRITMFLLARAFIFGGRNNGGGFGGSGGGGGFGGFGGGSSSGGGSSGRW